MSLNLKADMLSATKSQMKRLANSSSAYLSSNSSISKRSPPPVSASRILTMLRQILSGPTLPITNALWLTSILIRSSFSRLRSRRSAVQ